MRSGPKNHSGLFSKYTSKVLFLPCLDKWSYLALPYLPTPSFCGRWRRSNDMAASKEQSISSVAIYSFFISLCLYFAYRRFSRYRRTWAFMRANNCFPAPAAHRYPFKEPILGLDFALQIVRAAKSRRFLDYLVDLHKRYSPTMINHTFSMYLVWTDEPENIKTALSTRFDDWAIGPIRQVLIKDLLGDGIFTTDGAYWQHSRAMVRPNFARDQVADLDALEEHMQNLLALLPRDGSTVDLQELFHRYSMDASTEFLMGESTRTLLPGHSKLQEQFAKGIELGLKDATDRSQRGWFYHLISHAEVKAAIREVRRLVDPYVEHALEYRRKHLEAKERGEAGVEEEKYVFLHELAKETDDPLRLKNEVLNFLVAGRDTTASLLSTLWFMLARYPRVWKKLQAEVDGLEGKLPTYEKLRNMRYLKHCASESGFLTAPWCSRLNHLANTRQHYGCIRLYHCCQKSP